jgi:hypothetical protein
MNIQLYIYTYIPTAFAQSEPDLDGDGERSLQRMLFDIAREGKY